MKLLASTSKPPTSRRRRFTFDLVRKHRCASPPTGPLARLRRASGPVGDIGNHGELGFRIKVSLPRGELGGITMWPLSRRFARSCSAVARAPFAACLADRVAAGTLQLGPDFDQPAAAGGADRRRE